MRGIVCICGSIPRKAIERRLGLHHTLEEGSHSDFYRAYAQVTAAQAQLTPANAAFEIDRVIRTAWTMKCPVYIELPSDIRMHPWASSSAVNRWPTRTTAHAVRRRGLEPDWTRRRSVANRAQIPEQGARRA